MVSVLQELVSSDSNARRPASLICSFQAEGMVVLHLLRKRISSIPVLFLDTVMKPSAAPALRGRDCEVILKIGRS